MLEEKNLFGIENKIDIAIQRLQAYQPKNKKYFLAFSGGKDSIVIYKLAQLSKINFQGYYNITGIDHPELFKFIKNEYSNIIRIPIQKTMWQLIVENKFPPTRKIRYCCRILKEREIKNIDNSFVITGVRWQESVKRSKRRLVEQCMKNNLKFYIHPIIDWTEKEVWEFIKKYDLKYCELYDKGYKRLGCIGCPNAKNQKQQLEDYPKFKKLYLRAFKKMLEERKKKDLDIIWKDENHVMDWWLSDFKMKIKDTDQTILFE